MSNFENKKAIVLGGTSGIGLAATEMLRDAGAEVVTGSRSECDTRRDRFVYTLNDHLWLRSQSVNATPKLLL